MPCLKYAFNKKLKESDMLFLKNPPRDAHSDVWQRFMEVLELYFDLTHPSVASSWQLAREILQFRGVRS
jgi:hypothetical protein